MILSDDTMSYLRGDQFSSNFIPQFEYDAMDKIYMMRRKFLFDLCADKQIIHLGCVDHNANVIQAKIKRNKWLHATLCQSAKRCLGIDINQQGIDYLRDTLNYKDVLCADILANDCSEIVAQKWDYLLIPEVLEHQNNPVQFLSDIRHRHHPHIDQFVITVPNAFDISNFQNARKGQEPINSDHRYWFTPFTLAKILSEAGFKKFTFRLTRNGVIKKRAIFRNNYLARRPLLRNNLIAIAC